jgi:C4-dicarboxylate-binding protein DctP
VRGRRTGGGPGAFAQQPIVIKFSHVVAVDTPKGKGAEYFKKLAEERTKGRVKVEVYPNSQLYKDGEEMEALQLGSVHMLAPSVAKFGPLGAREFEAFDLPYLFDNFAELHKVTQGPVGKQLFQKLETKGIIGLAFWDNGFKSLSANRALKLPADVKGLKMRIQSSNVLEAQMRALGASAEDGVLGGLSRACRPASSTAPRIRRRTSIRRRCTRCRSS